MSVLATVGWCGIKPTVRADETPKVSKQVDRTSSPVNTHEHKDHASRSPEGPGQKAVGKSFVGGAIHKRQLKDAYGEKKKMIKKPDAYVSETKLNSDLVKKKEKEGKIEIIRQVGVKTKKSPALQKKIDALGERVKKIDRALLTLQTYVGFQSPKGQVALHNNDEEFVWTIDERGDLEQLDSFLKDEAYAPKEAKIHQDEKLQKDQMPPSDSPAGFLSKARYKLPVLLNKVGGEGKIESLRVSAWKDAFDKGNSTSFAELLKRVDNGTLLNSLERIQTLDFIMANQKKI